MIHIIEDHDEAFHLWTDYGLNSRTIIHIDAHSDCQKEEDLHIGSYLYHAFNYGIVKKCYWVIPEPASKCKLILKRLVTHLKENDIQIKHCDLKKGVVKGELNGNFVWMGPLNLLPNISETVLLDIDIDYFTLPFSGVVSLLNASIIWQDPEYMLKVLKNKKIEWDITTVCTSVNGGYTPIQWRCLAPCIESLLKGELLPFSLNELNKGAKLYWSTRKQNKRLVRNYFEKLLTINSDSTYLATVHTWLTRINVEMKDYKRAKQHYQSLLSIDPVYNTIWNCPALPYLYAGDKKAASYHFTIWEPILGEDPYFNLLWAESIYEFNPTLAIELCENVLLKEPTIPDTHLIIGESYNKIGDKKHSILSYEKALALTFTNSHTSSFLNMIQCQKSRERKINSILLRQILFRIIHYYIKEGSLENTKKWFAIFKKNYGFSPKEDINLFISSPSIYKKLNNEGYLRLEKIYSLIKRNYILAHNYITDNLINLYVSIKLKRIFN